MRESVAKRKRGVLETLLILNILMATRISLTRSVHPLLKRNPFSRRSCVVSTQTTSRLPKSFPCPLWSSLSSSSFPLCVHKSAATTTFSSSPTCSYSVSSMASTIESNPLLQDFDFPPFDAVEASHVRPGIRALLKNLVRDTISRFNFFISFICLFIV